MSFEYCKYIRRNEHNEIELKLASNNVHPREYNLFVMKNEDGGAVARLARLVYSRDIQLLASAKRTDIGQRIEWAIKQVGYDEDFGKCVERVGLLASLGNK